MRSLLAPVTVYGQPGCRFCGIVTDKLDEAAVEYDYVDISTNDVAKNYVVNVIQAKQVPVVVDERGVLIGDQPKAWEGLIEYHTSSETGL